MVRNLQVSMVNASTVAVINGINKLLKVSSSFIFFESAMSSL